MRGRVGVEPQPAVPEIERRALRADGRASGGRPGRRSPVRSARRAGRGRTSPRAASAATSAAWPTNSGRVVEERRGAEGMVRVDVADDDVPDRPVGAGADLGAQPGAVGEAAAGVGDEHRVAADHEADVGDAAGVDRVASASGPRRMKTPGATSATPGAACAAAGKQQKHAAPRRAPRRVVATGPGFGVIVFGGMVCPSGGRVNSAVGMTRAMARNQREACAGRRARPARRSGAARRRRGGGGGAPAPRCSGGAGFDVKKEGRRILHRGADEAAASSGASSIVGLRVGPASRLNGLRPRLRRPWPRPDSRKEGGNGRAGRFGRLR